MNVRKNRKKCDFLTIVPSEKLEYLKNGTIFFQTACAEMLQTLAPTTYIKTSPIGDHRLSSFCMNRSWLMRNGSYVIRLIVCDKLSYITVIVPVNLKPKNIT